MTERTILRLANGCDIDLRAPTPADYADFRWLAEHLAKESRFNGATPGTIYSVGQHLVLGTRAILTETDDRVLAAYFSVHDCHEAALRDDTTPKKHAIAEEIAAQCGVMAPVVLDVLSAITERHDVAIHAAAGLPWPPTPEIAAAVKYWDRVMLVTEWRDLMGGAPLPNAADYGSYPPLPEPIVPRGKWQSVQIELLTLWHGLLPAAMVGASA